jgi:hypothetical protein
MFFFCAGEGILFFRCRGLGFNERPHFNNPLSLWERVRVRARVRKRD